MKLRNKTIIIICLTLLGLIILLYSASQIILMESFTRLEEQDNEKNIGRVNDALQDDIDRLESIAVDWGAWDDTYIFIQDHNEGYIESNLDTVTIINLRANFMLFYNVSGHLYEGVGVDIDNNETIDIPGPLQSLSPDNALLKHTGINSSIKGIIVLPEGPVLIASQPIVTSEREGPIKGTVVIARFLDSSEVEKLSRITHLSLSASRFDKPDTPDFMSAVRQLSNGRNILIDPINDEIIAGYLLLNDIGGNPAVVIKAEVPRGIYMQGKNTMKYLVLSIIGSGMVFGIVNLWLLEKNVLSRLAFLCSDLSVIGASGDHCMRVSMTGKDELSKLSEGINSMLEKLENAEKENKKQLLFREIFHRVKNNLQIIISLLNLQSQKTNDKKTIEIFKDSQTRIKSMALIHERLYKSKNLSGINFKEYTNDLVNDIFRSYGVNSNINLKLDMDDIILNLDTATPCGLIITELVSNSIKHAFPDGRRGEIFIKLKSENEQLTLIVRDNGIGIPEDLDYEKSDTLGLRLVRGLVDQITGKMQIDGDNGTEFKITFSEKKGGGY